MAQMTAESFCRAIGKCKKLGNQSIEIRSASREVDNLARIIDLQAFASALGMSLPMERRKALGLILHEAREIKRKLAYTPKTNALYNAALIGFATGACFAHDIAISPAVSSTFTPLTAEAVVFAEAVDSAIGIVSPSNAQIAFLANICQAAMANKYSTLVTESAFAAMAASLAAFYSEAAGAFAIVPPPAPTTETITSSTVLTEADLGPHLFVDTTGGPVTLTLPPVLDGGELCIVDPVNGGSWQTHACSLTVTNGAKIQSPNQPLVYSAVNGTIALTEGGASIEYVGCSARNTWIKQ